MNQEDIVNRVTSKGVQFIIECIKGGYADYNNPNGMALTQSVNTQQALPLPVSIAISLNGPNECQ